MAIRPGGRRQAREEHGDRGEWGCIEATESTPLRAVVGGADAVGGDRGYRSRRGTVEDPGQERAPAARVGVRCGRGLCSRGVGIDAEATDTGQAWDSATPHPAPPAGRRRSSKPASRQHRAVDLEAPAVLCSWRVVLPVGRGARRVARGWRWLARSDGACPSLGPPPGRRGRGGDHSARPPRRTGQGSGPDPHPTGPMTQPHQTDLLPSARKPPPAT